MSIFKVSSKILNVDLVLYWKSVERFKNSGYMLKKIAKCI